MSSSCWSATLHHGRPATAAAATKLSVAAAAGGTAIVVVAGCCWLFRPSSEEGNSGSRRPSLPGGVAATTAAARQQQWWPRRGGRRRPHRLLLLTPYGRTTGATLSSMVAWSLWGWVVVFSGGEVFSGRTARPQRHHHSPPQAHRQNKKGTRRGRPLPSARVARGGLRSPRQHPFLLPGPSRLSTRILT